ncbi:kinase-like domain-containing protein [Rhizophagus diaphanus]|nr:kinase-like domain-containing protein [Rhizophagus diaphanus] [Rhizophagus sp. MUCL 43196]
MSFDSIVIMKSFFNLVDNDVNPSYAEEQIHGKCMGCKQVDTSLLCQACDSNIKEQNYKKCRECKQVKLIDRGKTICHICYDNFREKKYGTCKECKQLNTGLNWCQTCNSKRFQQNFSNWTSGNNDVDKFIQNTQLSAKSEYHLLEWISYDRFHDIKHIATGGFGEIYKAKWKDNYISNWNVNKHKWKRHKPNKDVVLKSLNKSENITLEFINEITLHLKIFEDKSISQFIRCYGITQNLDTKDYIMVMEYANSGNLRNYYNIRKSRRRPKPRKSFTFDYKLRYKFVILGEIISGLKRIHAKGLIHRDLHIGNIVCFRSNICITDMGLCKPVNYKELENIENSVYGVLPYLAPEILRGQHYTQASDIYSFGIIMYEVISGMPPYYDNNDDGVLALRICEGLRPKFNFEVPQLILHLIKSCLDANPLNRPNALYLAKSIFKWIHELSAHLSSIENQTESIKTEIVKQVEEAERINDSLSTDDKLPSTNKNFEATTSKLLSFKNLPKPKNSDDYYSNYDNISSIEYPGSLKSNNTVDCLDCEILKHQREVDFHENIIRFYGITTDQDKNYILVMKYADGGTLRNFLKEYFSNLNWDDKFNLALQLAYAVHSGNVLVHQNNVIKLADFGLSILLTGMIPYIDPKSLIMGISQGFRETPVPDTPIAYTKLYTDCWNGEPDNRPTMNKVVDQLKLLLSHETIRNDQTDNSEDIVHNNTTEQQSFNSDNIINSSTSSTGFSNLATSELVKCLKTPLSNIINGIFKYIFMKLNEGKELKENILDDCCKINDWNWYRD